MLKEFGGRERESSRFRIARSTTPRGPEAVFARVRGPLWGVQAEPISWSTPPGLEAPPSEPGKGPAARQTP